MTEFDQKGALWGPWDFDPKRGLDQQDFLSSSVAILGSAP